ncbi:hypothetical protein FE257_009428 [Aspergillus nanangensis]|uniref:Uncharacterized protein n=1 Tax=Aspergillus nanangensis TaxID=2582783 RepID=A0AAD4GST4_ASPNN|nr:hypothetical protein FE257_009428 [Aspergillus nanangensis]
MQSLELSGPILRIPHHESRKDHGNIDIYPIDSKDPQDPVAPSLDRSATLPNSDLDLDRISHLASHATRLVHQQRDASASRSHLRELRIALRHKRDHEAELRATLMKKLLPLDNREDDEGTSVMQNLRVEPSSLLNDYRLLQSATVSYLDMENTYHQAEDSLSQQEYMLDRSMERFARLSMKSNIPILPDEQHLLPPPSLDQDNEDDTSSFDSTPKQLPPGLQEYLSRIGDVQILQERLSELDSEYLSITSKRDQKETLHISLDEVDEVSLEFLRTYDFEWQKTWDDLHHAQFDANALEFICADRGQLTEDYKSRLDYIYQYDIIYQVSEILETDPAEHVQDPLKLPAEHNNFSLEASSTSKLSPSLFITKWTLHQLRISTTEIRHLKSTPDIQGLLRDGVDDFRISQLVITTWFEDNFKNSSRSSSQYDYGTGESRSLSGSGLELPGKQKDVLSKGSLTPFFALKSNKAEFSISYGSLYMEQ